MALSKSLLITSLSVVLSFYHRFPDRYDYVGGCSEIQVTWSKKDTSGGMNNGSIDLAFEDDRSQFAVYILTASGKTKLKSTEISIRNLKRGKHTIVITGEKEGSDFCQKFFEVVIN
ncbi:MAG: hypothetical protein HRU69_10670 [Flammeovirgaceae bacterium]|nr:MAG: hypothetical protein HRU69_10670 [Flammeovirgaceae bacterium]